MIIMSTYMLLAGTVILFCASQYGPIVSFIR
jgi:hypothetical protein